MAVEKRVFFRSRWLPWALLAPQLFVIVAFFFWPAGQALLQSLQYSGELVAIETIDDAEAHDKLGARKPSLRIARQQIDAQDSMLRLGSLHECHEHGLVEIAGNPSARLRQRPERRATDGELR